MPWHHWINLTEQDTMRIAFVQMAYQNQLHVQQLAQPYLHRQVALQEVDTAQGEATQPFPAYLNRVEENLNRLDEALPWPLPRGQPRTWLGEWRDVPTFRAGDVNRWFADLESMRQTLLYACVPRLVSGAFCSGGSRQAQIIRRRVT